MIIIFYYDMNRGAGKEACQIGLCGYAKMEFFCVAGGPLGRLVSPHSSLRLLLLVTAQILLVSGQSQGKA